MTIGDPSKTSPSSSPLSSPSVSDTESAESPRTPREVADKKTARLSQKVFSESPIQEDLKSAISDRALLALKLPDLAKARQALLNEIKANPGQLLVDIGRLGTVTVGDKAFSLLEEPKTKKPYSEEPKAKDAPQILCDLSLAILDHVELNNKALVREFVKVSDELLYVTCQQFRSSQITKAEQELNPGKEKEWGAEKTSTQSKLDIRMHQPFLNRFFGLNPTTLKISSQTTQSFFKLPDMEEKKEVTVRSDCYYDLATKAVRFELSYTIDGKTKQCKTDTPLDFESHIYK